MVEQSDHCPHLGLKQNRAIRFATPTPEHRCYITGDAQDIPVDQANYCLSKGHVNCPLYMGLNVPSTMATAVGTTAQVLPQTGLRGWLGGLSPRDRAIYGFLLALLVVIFGIYAAVGFQLLTGNPAFGNVSPFAPIEAPSATATTQTATPTMATATSSPAPSDTPARMSVTASRTRAPSRTPRTSTATPVFMPPQQPLPIPTVTVGGIATETPEVVPDSTPSVTPDVSPDDTPGLPTGTPPGDAATATPKPADTTEPEPAEPTMPGGGCLACAGYPH